MKKLNKKGVTLIELIVSFAIVSVAMIYFYQTIVDLHRMYRNSNKATDEFVNKDYALRVLDAWATKSDNNLSDLLSTASSPVKICYMYNMACDDNETKYENDGEFKKITLIDSSNKVLAVYYKYEKTLVDLKLESAGALDGYGNVKNKSDMEKLKEKNSDKVTITISDEGKITYKVEDENNKVRYTKTNTNTIKEIIEIDTELEKTEQGINEKVQKLVGDDYTIKESVEEIKAGVYARVYNIVKADTNATVAKNIYEIENTQMEKLDEFNLDIMRKANFTNVINKEITFNAYGQKVQNKGSYYLTFELSSNSTSNYCALFFSTDGTTSIGKEYDFKWNSEKIESRYIDNVKDIGINYEKKSDGSYIASFIRFNATNQDAYIKPYVWNSTDCKAKLVKAYKYNN